MTNTSGSTSRRELKRRFAIFLWVLGALVLLAFTFAPSGAPAREGKIDAAVSPMMPDLSMAPVGVCCVGITEEGQWSLRFSATIINVGSGDFVVSAQRWSRFAPWSVRQQIDEVGGGFSEVTADGAEMIWGGDGHDHWHVREIETHWLETLDGSEVIGTIVKPGFCFFDTTEHDLALTGSPSEAVWRAAECGSRGDTSVVMGLSVGWGDTYEWHLFDQHIDVTGIEPGRYRIRALADPQGWFTESDEENNESWTVVDFSVDADGLPHVAVVEESPLP